VRWRRHLLGAALAAFGCAPAPVAPAPAPGVADHAPPPRAAPPDGAVQVAVEPWQFGGDDGQVLATAHYRLYTTLSDHPILDHLPVFMERALEHYTTALVGLPLPAGELETYLFASRSQWEAKTRQMLPDQAGTYLAMGRGGFTTRGASVLYYIGRRDTFAILAHEGWHQYAQRTLRTQLPLWMEEGIATWMEGHVRHPDGIPKFRPWANVERFDALRDAVRAGRLIPFSELVERAPTSFLEGGTNRLLTYYGQVWALVHFLEEAEGGRYRSGLQQALLDAADGRLAGRVAAAPRQGGTRYGPAVLRTYFDPDLDDLARRYDEFVRAIVRTGAKDLITQGRSPVE
jgi:hypothetical protein